MRRRDDLVPFQQENSGNAGNASRKAFQGMAERGTSYTILKEYKERERFDPGSDLIQIQ